MPQIDKVTYLPIIFWLFIFMFFGYLLLNVYLYLPFVNIMKIKNKYRVYVVQLATVKLAEIRFLNAAP